jgi:hypothetical protein
MSIAFIAPSPDGKKLFADGWLPRGELVTYDHRSHQFVPFLSGISAGELDFSPDGKWIAYVAYPEGTLWRSRADGSERLQLTYPPVSPLLPHWSPNSTQIVFIDKQPGRPWSSYLISAQGGAPEPMLVEKEYQLDNTSTPINLYSNLWVPVMFSSPAPPAPPARPHVRAPHVARRLLIS